MQQKSLSALLAARVDDSRAGLIFEKQEWTWAEFVDECFQRAEFLNSLKRKGRRLHLGILLENTPEYLFLVCAASLVNATIIGINPTRRGAELARDISHTDCDAVVTDSSLLHHIEGLEIGVDTERVYLTDSKEYRGLTQGLSESLDRGEVFEEASKHRKQPLLFLFTSGSTGSPKAVICSSERFASLAMLNRVGIRYDDVTYNTMPLFHGNAFFGNIGPAMYMGATIVLRRKFSASGFVTDVQAHNVTYFNYVGRALSLILTQPEVPEEGSVSLRACWGTEASWRDRTEFARRYSCDVKESYGASEGGITIWVTQDSPVGSLGRPPSDLPVEIIDPQSGKPCAVAEFDQGGLLSNSGEAIGEIVSTRGARHFEGYFNDPEATAAKTNGEWLYSGDLGYKDKNGFVYFGGRSSDRARVDGENFATGPVEIILERYPAVDVGLAFPIADIRTGDQVMAVLKLAGVNKFNPVEFAEFLLSQDDLGSKWAPAFIRVCTYIPLLANGKVDRARLRKESWVDCDDVVYWRPGRGLEYEVMSRQTHESLRQSAVLHGRGRLLGFAPEEVSPPRGEAT